MLARRLLGSDWATRKVNASPWRFALSGTYAVGTASSSQNAVGADNAPKTLYVVRMVPGTATIEFSVPSNATISGRVYPGKTGLLDMAGAGGPPPAMPANGAVGRFATTPGDVARNPSSLYAGTHALTSTDVIGGGLALRMVISGSSGTLRLTNLATGQVVTQGTRVFPLSGYRGFTTGTTVYVMPGTSGGPNNTKTAIQLGATNTLAQVEVAADDKRPRRFRLTRAVYEDDGRPMFYKGVPGQVDAGLYVFPWERPLTTGTRGRGTNLSVFPGHVVRNGVCWLRADMLSNEHEIGLVLTNGTLASGSKFTTHLMRTYSVQRSGFIKLKDEGAEFVWFNTTRIEKESDLVQYYRDDGTAEDTYNFASPARTYAVVSTTTVDRYPAGARDGGGKAKGAADFAPATAVPGFVTQSRLLAVNGSFIDRYAHDGTYVDRIANPTVTGGTVSYANLDWNHIGWALSLGAQSIPFHLAASDSVCLPTTIQNNTATHNVTSDDGRTWNLYRVVNPLNVPAAQFGGGMALFPT